MPTIRTACCSPALTRVNFELPSNPDVVRIPTSALIFREHGTEVAILGPGDKIELKPMTLGRNLGTEVEVVKGLTLADRVVNSPPDSLAAGDTVHIAGQPAPGGRATSGNPVMVAGRTWRPNLNRSRIKREQPQKKGGFCSPGLACGVFHGVDGFAGLRRSNRKFAREFAFGRRSRHSPRQPLDRALRNRMEPRATRPAQVGGTRTRLGPRIEKSRPAH